MEVRGGVRTFMKLSSSLPQSSGYCLLVRRADVERPLSSILCSLGGAIRACCCYQDLPECSR
jgi:hypothetical protein